MTVVNNALGSPAYMSPEQVRSASSIDLRTDLWAVGVILYELCSGTRPFEAANVPEVLAFILERDPEPLSARRAGIPPGLEAVIARCLHKNVDQRFASAAELALALAPHGPWAGARVSFAPEQRRESVPAPAPPASEPAARTADGWTQKSRAGAATSSPYLTMVLLGAGIGVALLAVGGVVLALRGAPVTMGPREALASSTAVSASGDDGGRPPKPPGSAGASSVPAVSADAVSAETVATAAPPPPPEPAASAAAIPSAGAGPAPKPGPLRHPSLSRQRR
jgi:serine/threonine-protein kinase